MQEYFTVEKISEINTYIQNQTNGSKKLHLAKEIFSISHYAFDEKNINLNAKGLKELHECAMESLEKHMDEENKDLPLKRAFGETWIAAVSNNGHLDKNNFSYYDKATDKVIDNLAKAKTEEEKEVYANILSYAQQRIAFINESDERIHKVTEPVLDFLVKFPNRSKKIIFDMEDFFYSKIDISVEKKIHNIMLKVQDENPDSIILSELVNNFQKIKELPSTALKLNNE